MTPNPTKRFSNRVADYVKYRPSYPPELLEFLRSDLGLGPTTRVADIGAGTGIFTRQLLAAGAGKVHAIEPNREMREEAERELGAQPGFSCGPGTAEATGLDASSVDLITAAQAFHWFDQPRARSEFARVLRPGGRVALIWNDRRVSGTPFLEDYEALLRAHGTDYVKVNHRNVEASGAIGEFFAPTRMEQALFANVQVFDYDGLAGRLRSSSYVPAEGEPGFAPMMAALRALYDRHVGADGVRFEYETKVFYGTLGT